jgi:hypothetical protein
MGTTVQACTNLANSIWSPVRTITLVSGSYYFNDPQWTYYPCRFYRLTATTFGGRPIAPW